MEKKRNLSFDLLKGILIILVVTGHILPGSAEHGVRGLIYYFHMPLFLGVTGYFVRKKVIDSGWLSILKKYQWRMLTPYLLAFTVYSLYSLYISIPNEDFGIKSVLRFFMYPYYHLWYVPAVLLFVFYTKIAYRNLTTLVLFYFLTAIISIVWHGFGSELEERFQLLKLMGDKRFYYYSSFFILGFILGDKEINIKKTTSFMLVISSVFCSLFITDNALLNSILWYLFNVFLVILMVDICKIVKITKKSFLVKIGQVSLPIYLWHVAPIIIIGFIFERGTSIYYAGVLISVFTLLYSLVALRGKSKFLDGYFYGEPQKSREINEGDQTRTAV